MVSTIGRLQSLRLTQRAAYFDLARQAGASESNGGGFSDAQLQELDRLSCQLGVSESAVARDVGSARQFFLLSQKLTGAAETRADAASRPRFENRASDNPCRVLFVPGATAAWFRI